MYPGDGKSSQASPGPRRRAAQHLPHAGTARIGARRIQRQVALHRHGALCLYLDGRSHWPGNLGQERQGQIVEHDPVPQRQPAGRHLFNQDFPVPVAHSIGEQPGIAGPLQASAAGAQRGAAQRLEQVVTR
jgi:hypothetical protein